MKADFHLEEQAHGCKSILDFLVHQPVRLGWRNRWKAALSGLGLSILDGDCSF